MKEFDIFYFSSTHWDREWYQDFQSYRYRLVKLVDKLVDLFNKDPEYKTFHFDGQTVVLEDYAEIRPEMKEKLKSLIAEGKILVGPWYVMPDEFLVSGESLIRNLMQGHELAKAWGAEAWKHGFVCDIFGHIAQFPQILAGFNIHSATLGRGTDEDFRSFFRWRSPDGTTATVFNLEPEHGYGMFNYIYRFEGDKSANNPNVIKNITNYIDSELKRSGVPVIVLMNGLDHNEAAPETTEYIKKIAELYPSARVHHVNLLEGIGLADRYHDKMATVDGELNLTAKLNHSYLKQILNTLSSYYPLKQQNDLCQNTLEKIVEPTAVLGLFDNVPLNRSFVKTAYRYLIKNHPHDSICGCSIDQVHKDMQYRFDQVKEISNVFCGDYLNETFRSDENTDEKGYSSILSLQNYLPYDVDKTVTVDLEMRHDYIVKYGGPGACQMVNSFLILDKDGNEIPYQVIKIKNNQKRMVYNQPLINGRNIYTVTFRAKIPAMAKCEYKIVPHYMTSRYIERLNSGLDFVENDFIRVDIAKNGTLTLTDKKTNKSYSNLLNLVNDGEIGDGWFHECPFEDIVASTACGDAQIAKVEDGPERCVFKITRKLTVPAALTVKPEGRSRNAYNTVDLIIDTFVGLSSENRFVDVKMEYNNIAKDHRMRLFIPTGINNNKYFAGQAFCYVERETGIDPAKAQWNELPEAKATNGIVGKCGCDQNGIAFVCAEGIHECESFNDDLGTLSVTLSRSFYTTVFTNGETACQINGPLSYRFALSPLAEDIKYNDLLKIQDYLSVNVPVKLTKIKKETELKEFESAIKVEGENIAVSVIKRAEDDDNAIIIRVFNTEPTLSTGKITLCRDILSAQRVNLNEEYIEDIKVNCKTLDISLEPCKIATYKFKISN